MWGAGLWSWLRHRSAAASTGLDLAPRDAVELNLAAARIAGEFALSAPEVIVAAAGRLQRRQVPVSAVRGSALTPGLGELQFADGTTITVRSHHQGDLARVSVRMLTARVMLDGIVVEPSGVNLEVLADGRPALLLALGVRQPR